MSLLGVQVVISMIAASILHKLMPFYSIGRWFLCCGLVRYLHPTNEDLKTLTLGAMANTQSGINKGQRRRNGKRAANSNGTNGKKEEPFNVPKNLEFQLDTAKVQPIDVLQLHYYTDYQWLIDFSFMTLVVYITTEVYSLLQPQSEFNISMVWCFMAVVFSMKSQLSLSIKYFSLTESGEMIMIITSGCFYFVLAMGIVIVDESILDLELLPAYYNFTTNARILMTTQGLESHGPISLVTFRVILTVICALIGALLTFPGLRLAKMHTDALKYNKEDPFVQLCLYINFLFPMVIGTMWIKPYVRDFLTVPHRRNREAIMSDNDFESMRLITLILFCFLRLCLMKTHLQAHLNLAYEKVENLKLEAGKISSIELQRMIARVFYFLCVVALQYVAPIVFIVFLTCMLKTMANLSWFPFVDINIALRNATPLATTTNTVYNASFLSADLKDKVGEFALTLANIRNVFNAFWFKGVFSFLCWWTNTAWFIASVFGLLYHSYFQA